MNLHIPNAVSSRVARQVLVTKKHSPTILFAAGVVGMVATTVTACRATLRVEELLEEHQNKVDEANEVYEYAELGEYTDAQHKKDLLYLHIRFGADMSKLYGPALLLGFFSVACLTQSHRILTTRNAGLIAAYSALERGFDQYRGRVVDKYGADEDRELRYGVETETVVTEGKNGKSKTEVVKHAASGDYYSIYARLFEEGNPDWSANPEYSLIFLRAQQNYANDRLKARGHLFLNEVYDALNLPHTKAGAIVGWVWQGDGDNKVDFGIFRDDACESFYEFMVGRERAIWLDFNVDGIIYDKI